MYMSIHTCLINNLILDLWFGHRDVSIVQPVIKGGKMEWNAVFSSELMGETNNSLKRAILKLDVMLHVTVYERKCFFPSFPSGVVIKTL